jgi:RHS repeat-associated protein
VTDTDYDAADKLASAVSSVDGTSSYSYDGEGNRTKRVEISTGKITEYVWDYRNRLASVLFKDGAGVVTKTIDYTYDGNNQRIGKKIDGVTTERYVLDRNQISLVFDGAGNQTHRYLYGTGIDRVLADETPTSIVWALADNQGTVKDLIDNVGNAVSHINYDSFGRVVSQTGSVDFRYGYTGREQDAETGLDYYRARYYDVANGRFISEDPIGFAAGDTNLYRYVGNSPVNWIDPSGLRPRATPVDGDQSVFTGGGPLRGGGPPSGVNFGRGNSRPTSPYTPSVDPRYRYQPSDRGTPNYGVPSNSTPTPIPRNNPDVPDPNTCIKFKDSERKLADKVELSGNETKNKKCKYAYILRSDYDTRASVYSIYVSKSVYEFAVISKKTGEIQLYDGITPGTTNVWEAKSTADSEVGALRSIYQRGKTNQDSLSDKERGRYKSLTERTPKQLKRSARLAKECGFNFQYASRSQQYKEFLENEVTEYPKNIVNIQHIPLPALDIFFP